MMTRWPNRPVVTKKPTSASWGNRSNQRRKLNVDPVPSGKYRYSSAKYHTIKMPYPQHTPVSRATVMSQCSTKISRIPIKNAMSSETKKASNMFR